MANGGGNRAGMYPALLHRNVRTPLMAARNTTVSGSLHTGLHPVQGVRICICVRVMCFIKRLPGTSHLPGTWYLPRMSISAEDLRFTRERHMQQRTQRSRHQQ